MTSARIKLPLRATVRQQLLQGIGGLGWIATSAQLKCGSRGYVLPERRPTRLIDRVRLACLNSRHNLLPAKWCQQRTLARRLGRNKHDTRDCKRSRGKAELRAPQIDLEFLHAAAAADDGRLPDNGCAGSRHRVKRIAADVQKVRDSGGEHRIRRHKYAVLRQEIQTPQNTVQRSGRLSSATVADQEKSATILANACGMQRNEVLGARRKRKHRKLKELVTGVVGKSEHVSRHNDERRSIVRRRDRKIRGAARSAQHPRSGHHLDKRWFAPCPRAVGRCKRQSDAQARGGRRETVPRQTLVGPIHKAPQLGALALERKISAEQTHARAGHGTPPFVKRVGRHVGGGFPRAHRRNISSSRDSNGPVNAWQ
jgi:hypothetical protein